MNARRAKSFRRAVTLSGKHPRDAATIPLKPHRVFAGPVPGVGPSAIFLGHRTINPTSGRGMYRAAKRAFKRGELHAA